MQDLNLLTEETIQNELETKVLQSDPMAFALKYDLWKLPVPPEAFHTDWLSLAAEGKNLVLLAPKDFAKSTIFSFILPIWLICWNPDIRIILASDTHSQAVRRTRAIKQELMSNQKLIQSFGQFEPRRGSLQWSDDEFTVNQRINRSLVDATVRALGMGDAIEGARADWILIDDLCSLENMGTPDRRKKVHDWYFSPLLGCRETWSVVQAVGTRKHWGDLWGELKTNPEYFVPEDWEQADYVNEAGELCSKWEALWPSWRLEKLRSENRTSYDRDKRNQPMAPEDAPFPEEWMEAAKREGFDLIFSPARSLGLDYVVQAWDVAGQTSKEKAEVKKTAFYSCATIGRTREGKIILCDLWRGRGLSPSQWVKQVETQYLKHRPDVVVVETNGQQAYFREHAQEQTNIPILAHNTTYHHKLMMKNREAGLSIRLERGIYIFPFGQDQRTREEVDELCSELNQFGTTARSDAAMSLFMADCYLRGDDSQSKIFTSTTPKREANDETGIPKVSGSSPWDQSRSPSPY